MFQLFNLIGYAGVFLALLAFFLLQAGRLGSNSWPYQVMNVLSALFIMLSLIFESFNLPAFLQELAWFLISVYGIASSKHWRKLGHWAGRG